jgi:hypothetical protein
VETLIVTLRLDPGKATLEQIQARYGLTSTEVDANYGVVSVNPDDHLYTILVTEQAANRIKCLPGVVGVYSNPRIETFGPPRKR